VRDDDPQLSDYYNYCAACDIEPRVYPGEDIFGAAQTYDRIIDEAIREGCERLIVLDDDLTLAMANPILGASPMFRLTRPSETATLMAHAASLARAEVPLMSFTPIMARSQPGLVSYCKPVMMAYVFYLPHFAAHPEHRFWCGRQIEARCDLNLSLRLLTEGYLTAFYCGMFIPDNVNNPGGCSTYRDIDCERRSVAYLKAHYPQYVRTHKKRGWVGDPNIAREAPVVSWKRAFDSLAFSHNFKESAADFMEKHLATYGRVYAAYVKEIRDGKT
jgi:hypothetical protein